MTGLRPLLRLGRREARRHRGRTALVGLLIGVPVFALSLALVLLASFNPGGATQARWRTGRADDVQESAPSFPGVEVAPDPVTTPPPPGSRSITVRSVPVFTTTGRGAAGRVLTWSALAGPVADPMLDGHLARLSGRLPRRAGEVALTPDAAKDLGMAVGGVLDLAVPKIHLRVVGLAGDADCGSCSSIYLTAAALPDRYDAPGDPTGVYGTQGVATGATTYTTWPAGSRRAATVTGAADSSIGSSSRRATFLAYGVGLFGLIWTGLVAAAALAVGARRRRRELGVLAANGADPGGLRLAIVAEGLVIGGVASVLAAAAGTAVGTIVFPTVREWVRQWGGVRAVPWAWVITVPVVGTAAAALAAAAGARGIRRSTAGELLAGRGPEAGQPKRWLGAGLVVGVVGVVVLSLPTYSGSSQGRWLVGALGALIATAGLCAVSVGAVGAMAGLRGPGVSTRVVGRDLSRHGVRGSAAVAALALTVALWAGLVVQSARRDPAVMEAGLVSAPARTVLVASPSFTTRADGHGRLVVSGRRQTPGSGLGRRLASAGLRLRAVRIAPNLSVVVQEPGSDPWSATEAVMIVDPVLDLFSPADRASLRAGAVLSPDVPRGATATVGDQQVQVLPSLSSEAASFGSVATAATVRRLGVRPGELAVGLVADGTKVSDTTMARLSRSSSSLSTNDQRLYLGTGGRPEWVGYAGLGAVTVVMLVVLAISLALQRVESQADDEVLRQQGATPSIRRRVAGARAALIAASAVVPGIVLGVAVQLALDQGPWPVHVPFAQLVVGLLGVPAIAWALFAATSRAPRPVP